jgi:hypothetical protein
VERFVVDGSVGLRMNNDIGNYFWTLKELKQSVVPMFFNIIVDILAILIA